MLDGVAKLNFDHNYTNNNIVIFNKLFKGH